MKGQNPVKKTYLKTGSVLDYYQYQIFEVTAGDQKWLEATPITKGVTRTAENETILRILLANDAKTVNRTWNKTR